MDSETSLIYSDKPIEVIEANMQDVINNYKNNPHVAFAHCISADFNDKRQMSAGVALAFRNTFNRPKKTDSITKHLTLQDQKEQASVYGLVTKPSYYSKPSESDYNDAFSDFTSHFIQRSFKKLFCSPMGCMRDQIHPKLFARNIVAFQRRTKVPVSIIIYDERATRTLRNGLKHQDFLALLKSCIAKEESLQRGSTSSLQTEQPVDSSCRGAVGQDFSCRVDRDSTPELHIDAGRVQLV